MNRGTIDNQRPWATSFLVVVLFAIPDAKLEAYVEKIETLAKANQVLSTFHQLRRRDVEDGKTPTVRQSLLPLGA